MMLLFLSIVDCTIAMAQEEITQKTNNVRNIRISFSVRQLSFVDRIDISDTDVKLFPDLSSSPLGSESTTGLPADANNIALLKREIVGNDLDNNIQIQRGQNILFGNGGNDRFVWRGKSNRGRFGY